MKIVVFTALILVNINTVFAQDYDLIVKTNGDSIACRIDSITSTQYFFTMRINGNWVHTHIDNENVMTYDSNVVKKKTTTFLPGTSIIGPQNGISTMSYPGTALYVELGGKGYGSVNVDLILRQNHRMSLFISMTDYIVAIDNSESETKQLPTLGCMYSYLKGKNKSFFELGFGISTSVRLDLEYAYISENHEKYPGSPLNLHGVIGYRYQKSNGLLFRAGFTPLYNLGSFPLPIIGVSFGYSF